MAARIRKSHWDRAQSGLQVRFKNRVISKVFNGSAGISDIKFTFVPTNTSTHASAEVLNTIYKTTDTNGKITETKLLEAELFDHSTSSVNATTQWAIYARGLERNTTHQISSLHQKD